MVITDATTTYRTVAVDGLDIFYREAGPRDAPTLLLLHGFLSSSTMFSRLMPHFESGPTKHPLDTLFKSYMPPFATA